MSVEKKAEKIELRADLDAGTILDGKYKVISLLGHGGMGTVYKVEQILLHKTFALKMLQQDDTSETAWRRFQKEAQAIAKLNHPNLVREHGFGLIDGTQPYLVMELAGGEPLNLRLKRTGQISIEEALNIFVPICFALAYAHSERIVHRDIKPSNIILCEEDGGKIVPKIVDFGIVKILGDEENTATLTRTGEIFGTPYYMSPEQCKGEGVDARSDIYSLGCVIFESLTGVPPFPGDSPITVISQHLSAQPASLKDASFGTDFSSELERIVARMLAKDPAERYQSAEAVAKDLVALQHNPNIRVSQAATRPPVAQTVTAEEIFLRPQVLLAMALSVLLGAIIAVVLIGQLAPTSPKMPKEPLPSSQLPVVADFQPGRPAFQQYYSNVKVVNGVPMKEFKIPKDIAGPLRIYADQPSELKKILLPKEGGILPLGGNIVCEINPVMCGLRPEHLLRFRKDDLHEVSFKCYAALPHLPHGRELANACMLYIRPLESVHRLDLEPFGGYEDESIDDGGLRAVADMPNLQSLNLVSCDITGDGLLAIRNFANFEDLSIGKRNRNMSKALAYLGNHATRMKRIHLREMDVTAEDIASIAKLHSLRRMSLEDDKGVNDATIRPCAALTELEGLALVTTQIKDGLADMLPHFQNLRDLDLSFTPVSDRTVQAIGKLPHLVRLHISGTGVSPGSLKELANLSELNTLQLDASLVTPETIEYVAKLPKLRELQLDSMGDARAQFKLAMRRLPGVNISRGTRRGGIHGSIQKEFDGLNTASPLRDDFIQDISRDR